MIKIHLGEERELTGYSPSSGEVEARTESWTWSWGWRFTLNWLSCRPVPPARVKVLPTVQLALLCQLTEQHPMDMPTGRLTSRVDDIFTNLSFRIQIDLRSWTRMSNLHIDSISPHPQHTDWLPFPSLPKDARKSPVPALSCVAPVDLSPAAFSAYPWSRHTQGLARSPLVESQGPKVHKLEHTRCMAGLTYP